jgi:hypothetical protein
MAPLVVVVIVCIATRSDAFKRRMGMSVSLWMKSQ